MRADVVVGTSLIRDTFAEVRKDIATWPKPPLAGRSTTQRRLNERFSNDPKNNKDNEDSSK